MSDRIMTWRKVITEAMKPHEETWADVVRHTLSEGGLDREFDAGYGGPEGEAFILWTTNRVYFTCCYDGAEGAESVPRNPCSKAEAKPEHIGGY